MSKPTCVFIAGSNRSGTTWLQDILGDSLDRRVIFEPLHPRVSERRDWVRQYLGADDEAPELHAYLSKVVAGKVKDRWMMQGGHGTLWYWFRNRRWASTSIVKFVRANLMLEWLDKHFDAPIVFIVRHPCAVIASMRKMGWEDNLDWNFEVLKESAPLLSQFTESQRALIQMENPSPVQRLALIWCMENVIPLRQFPNHDWIGVVYEELVANGEAECRRIFERLGWDQPKKGFTALRKVAHTANKGSQNEGSVLNKWKRHLSDEEAAQILEILAGFDCKLYGDDPKPAYSHLEDMPSSPTPTGDAPE